MDPGARAGRVVGAGVSSGASLDAPTGLRTPEPAADLRYSPPKAVPGKPQEQTPGVAAGLDVKETAVPVVSGGVPGILPLPVLPSCPHPHLPHVAATPYRAPVTPAVPHIWIRPRRS